jgi:hypothetical protein
MENKNLGFRKFRQLLLDGMRMEIAQLANEQREQKKTRKLANRPEGKSLQSIVDEISNRAYKIHNLLYYYRWIRHGLKYWSNRNVQSFKDYYAFSDPNSWFAKNWDTIIEYGPNEGKTHGEVIIEITKNFYKRKCQEYNIECSDENIDLIISNI